MTHALTAQTESTKALASLFQAAGDNEVRLSVREDKCFKDECCLDLGRIVLKPSESEPGEKGDRALVLAAESGFYEWHLPNEKTLLDEVYSLTNLTDATRDGDQRSKARRALDSIANAICRVGLIHPVLDAGSLSNLPFRTPTTVVFDTSAIVQGGLDFVARFLYPMARIKVPAIAHMELLNAADNYFNMRRKKHIANGRMLLEHTFSQGGQRALLRSELQTGTEIERGRLGADPLRGVVEFGPDTEDKKLGLSVVQRSFADRLIFETARQHASQSNQDHPVFLMTSDQGLARMTIAEGMQPLFFEHGKLSTVSGALLTGTAFHPFTGRVYAVPLTSLLWELAVTFGSCRLSCRFNDSHLDVSAIGSDLPWQPYHTKDDLLWLWYRPPNGDVNAIADPHSSKGKAINHGSEQMALAGVQTVQKQPKKEKDRSGAYKFSPPRMLHLVQALAEKGQLTFTESLKVLQLEGSSQLEDYRNFLISGSFVEVREKSLVKTDQLDTLWSALKNRDLATLGKLLMLVPSFKAFMMAVSSDPQEKDYGIAKRALSTYESLAEAAALAASIPDEHIYPTPANPTPDEFSNIALSVYSSLSMGSADYILTGLWLETLVREYGIHPVVARDRLEEARAAGYLQRFTEGSTPETRYSRHTLFVLHLIDGKPTIRKIALFEGDFLLPGKSSVSLRLVRGAA